MTAIAYNKETLTGISIVSGIVIIFAVIDIHLISFTILLTIMGVISVYLYELKVYTAKQFYLIKVPLNILFNQFLIILLIKSWTMRLFKEDFEMLDKKIKEYKDKKNKEHIKDNEKET